MNGRNRIRLRLKANDRSLAVPCDTYRAALVRWIALSFLSPLLGATFVVPVVADETNRVMPVAAALPRVMRQPPSSPIHAVRPSVRRATKNGKTTVGDASAMRDVPNPEPSLLPEPDKSMPHNPSPIADQPAADRTTEFVADRAARPGSAPVVRFTTQSAPPPAPTVLESESIARPVGEAKLPTSEPVRLTPIGRLSTSVAAPAGELPRNYAAEVFRVQTRFVEKTSDEIRVTAPFYSTPRAAGFNHRPLYFEERELEREGRNFGVLQPVISGAKFFGTLPILPYKMGAQPQPRIISTGDGVDPPGDHLTHGDRIRGAVVEAATVTGLIFAIP